MLKGTDMLVVSHFGYDVCQISDISRCSSGILLKLTPFA